jgi:hypothetical protein
MTCVSIALNYIRRTTAPPFCLSTNTCGRRSVTKQTSRLETQIKPAATSQQIQTSFQQNEIGQNQFCWFAWRWKKINNQMIEQGRHFAAQKRKRTALKLIAMIGSNDNEVDRAVAQRLASMGNNNNNNVPIKLPRGGTSRLAVYKRRRHGGLLLTGLAKMWGKQAKIAPEIIQDEFTKTPQSTGAESASLATMGASASLRLSSNQETPILETPALPSTRVAKSSA